MASAEFSAVLFTGGASRRMGRDKATLRIGPEVLWERQQRVLRELAPAEIFISGRPDGPYAGAGLEIIPDVVTGSGPLGGLVASLRRVQTAWLVVLAIDLPLMQASALATMLEHALRSGRGRIPQAGGKFEPLAAVYPKSALTLAEENLAAGRLAMQSLARELIKLQLADPDPLSEDEPEYFRNTNTPEEWTAVQGEIVRS